MESNDKLNWQDDKDIEKIIPFDIGNHILLIVYRAPSLQWESAENQQMESSLGENPRSYY